MLYNDKIIILYIFVCVCVCVCVYRPSFICSNVERSWKSYHCLGFTTDGALRSSIDVRKWKDDSSVTLYARGLYVHNVGFRCLCYEIVLPWYINYTCHEDACDNMTYITISDNYFNKDSIIKFRWICIINLVVGTWETKTDELWNILRNAVVLHNLFFISRFHIHNVSGPARLQPL